MNSLGLAKLADLDSDGYNEVAPSLLMRTTFIHVMTAPCEVHNRLPNLTIINPWLR